MIPLRDSTRSGTVPFVTYGLVLANLLVFFWEATTPAPIDRILLQHAVIPRLFDATLRGQGPAFIDLGQRIMWSMFLHAGVWHVVGNMWFLWIFGDNVEDRMGHLQFALFYLVGGTVAALLQVFMSHGSAMPMIGASGAVAVVLGAYAVCFPLARILTLFFVFLVPLPALLVLVSWFFVQLAQSGVYTGAQGPGVAWWAHIGGFLFGAVFVFFIPKRPGFRTVRSARPAAEY